MDSSGFDDFTRLFVASHSRRSMIGTALGVVAAGFIGGRSVDAANKRNNGQICRKNGDCKSDRCGSKDNTGRRVCKCDLDQCLMLDGSPGDCSSGHCTCSNCSAECGPCLRNVEERFFCGVFFVSTETLGISTADIDLSTGGITAADLDGSTGRVDAAATGCASSEDCPGFDFCPALNRGPFCVDDGGSNFCTIAFECGPVTGCA